MPDEGKELLLFPDRIFDRGRQAAERHQLSPGYFVLQLRAAAQIQSELQPGQDPPHPTLDPKLSPFYIGLLSGQDLLS